MLKCKFISAIDIDNRKYWWPKKKIIYEKYWK